MPEQDLFEKFINELQFDVSDYLDSEISEFQKKTIEDATFILKDNIVDEVKKLGGNLQKNMKKFENFVKEAENELENDEFKDSIRELKQMLKDYVKKLRELIAKTCVVIIPVKEMPFIDVLFRTIPRIVIDKNKIRILDNMIAYYGEIQCIIPRTTIFGKIKDEEPLFAPYIGEINLGGYKFDESQHKGSKSEIFSYVSAIIDALDSTMTRSQLAKYHEGYQRHGEPICDFLMRKSDLLMSMEKVHSGLESTRIKSNIAVYGIAIPLHTDKKTLILITDEGKDSERFVRCFEALIRFSAACCEAPSSFKAVDIVQAEQGAQTTEPQTISQQTGVIRTPGGQELKVWSEEELAKEAKERVAEYPPGVETWDEESLAKLAQKRSKDIPEGMEIWTEEELLELAKNRQGGGLDVPEWVPDPNLLECSKCGYSLRKGWSECPICGTPIESKTSSANRPPPECRLNDVKDNQNKDFDETRNSESSESTNSK